MIIERTVFNDHNAVDQIRRQVFIFYDFSFLALLIDCRRNLLRFQLGFRQIHAFIGVGNGLNPVTVWPENDTKWLKGFRSIDDCFCAGNDFKCVASNVVTSARFIFGCSALQITNALQVADEVGLTNRRARMQSKWRGVNPGRPFEDFPLQTDLNDFRIALVVISQNRRHGDADDRQQYE